MKTHQQWLEYLQRVEDAARHDPWDIKRATTDEFFPEADALHLTWITEEGLPFVTIYIDKSSGITLDGLIQPAFDAEGHSIRYGTREDMLAFHAALGRVLEVLA